MDHKCNNNNNNNNNINNNNNCFSKKKKISNKPITITVIIKPRTKIYIFKIL